MKLHLPVKLRASLIAAVIAVSASVYNASARDYTTFGPEYITTQTPGLSGNTYTVSEITKYYTDSTKATEVRKSTDGNWYAVKADGTLDTSVVQTEPAGGWVSEVLKGELIFAATGSANPVTEFDGNTTITADVVQFNNNVVSPDSGVEGATTITADEVQVNKSALGTPSEVELEQLTLDTDATKIAACE